MIQSWSIVFALTLSFTLSSAPQDKPPAPGGQVLVKMAWIDTADDVWNGLREVDPAFKAIGDEVARLAKDLEAEDIETRSKAAPAIRSLGLSAYGAIKGVRDGTTSAAVRAELDAVMKTLADASARSLTDVPAARKIGAAEGAALLKRLKDGNVVTQQPMVSLKPGTPSSIFVGDSLPAETGARTIKIEDGGWTVRVEPETAMQPRGVQIKALASAIDHEKRTVSLEIAATALGPVTTEKAQKVTASLHPKLSAGQFFLAGPFPAAEQKGQPWWILLEVEIIKP